MHSFPPVYVISLARAGARRESMRARLECSGLRFEIIDAVDGKQLTPDDYADNPLRRDKFRRKKGRDITDGEIGCYLSHYRLWRRIVSEQTPCALVLEDDVRWDDDMRSVVRELAETAQSWSVALLSADMKKVPGRKLRGLSGGARSLVMCNRRARTTAAYMISQRGARELLEYCREITAPIDAAYGEWWRNGLAFYVVSPPVFRQEGESLIDVRGEKQKAKWRDRVTASLWRKYDRQLCRWRYLRGGGKGGGG